MQRLSYEVAANYMEMYTVKQIDDYEKQNKDFWEDEHNTPSLESYIKYITKYSGEHAIYVYKLKAKEGKVADIIKQAGEDGLYFAANGKKYSFIVFVPKGTCITLDTSANANNRRYKMSQSFLSSGFIYSDANKLNVAIVADGKVYDPIKVFDTVKEDDSKMKRTIAEYLFGVKIMHAAKSKWRLPNIVSKEDEDDAIQDAAQLVGNMEHYE